MDKRGYFPLQGAVRVGSFNWRRELDYQSDANKIGFPEMIYVLPGMGADAGMYTGPWHELEGSSFLDWPSYAGECSIKAVANQVIKDAGIKDGACLVGSSLGGIVACEIAKLRKLRALFLVGSAKKCEEVNGLLQALHPFVDLAPLEFIQLAAGKFPGELASMFHRSQAPFIRAMCRAIFEWKGLDESLITPFRIHGKKDKIIPLPADVQKVLDGGHLIAMTHSRECVEFIRSRLSSTIY